MFQSLLVQVSFKTPIRAKSAYGHTAFQSLLVQVSFKTETTNESNTHLVSIPSRSGLLQNPRECPICAGEERFNPFSFRSPSKLRTARTTAPGAVSIPSRSGLLQNVASRTSRSPVTFQSLLVQVSFKTQILCQLAACPGFNPFSFRSPSKRPRCRRSTLSERFNPFSFRSPSKRHGAIDRLL